MEKNQKEDTMPSTSFDSTPQHVTLIGNKGFVGRNIERHLKAFSNLKIIGLGKKEIDLTSEESSYSLRDYIHQDSIVILASGRKRNQGDNLDLFTINTAMAVNFCKAVAGIKFKKLVYVSSTAVYGEDVDHNTISEQTPVEPTSFYGMSKYISERILFKSLSENVGSLLVLRPPTIYGPDENANTYGPDLFVDSAIKSKTITLWGDGTERREFLYITDLVKIIISLSLSTCMGVVNIVSGKSYSFVDIIETIKRLGYYHIQMCSKERTKKKVDHTFDNAYLINLIGPYAFTSLDHGITNIINFKGYYE